MLRRLVGGLSVAAVVFVALTCVQLAVHLMLPTAHGGVADVVMAVSDSPLLRAAVALGCAALTMRPARPARPRAHRARPAAHGEDALIRPWLWDELDELEAPLTRQDKAAARARAREVARLTLGDELWKNYQRLGRLDVPSRLYGGVRYVVRPGRRVEVRFDGAGRCPASHADWRRRPFLCVEPDYLLPEDEFAAQLYIQLRDAEEYVVNIAIAQSRDGPIRHVF